LIANGTNEWAALRRLARLNGVQTSYLDMEKARVSTTPETLLAALRALGVGLESMADVAGALTECRRRLWSWSLDPVVVAWDGTGAATLRLPAEESHHRMDAHLQLESGESRSWGINLTDVPPLAIEEIGGEVFVAKSLPLPRLAPGYHRLAFDVAGRHREALVISSPRKAHPLAAGRGWGLFLPLYAMRPRQGQPIADYQDLQRFLAFTAESGGSLTGTLPLLPTFLDQPFDPSPYSPVSRLFWNELYVTTKAEERSAPAEPEGAVDYPAAMRAKRATLQREAASLSVRESADLERFLEQKPSVRDYAMFRGAAEKLGSFWHDWPEPARGGRLNPDDCDETAVRFYAYAQWRAQEQMTQTRSLARDRGVELYLDLPVGVHPDGYDAWRSQPLFVEGMSIGAPPDIVTTSGQDWGSRPLHPERLRQSGYRYMIDYIRHNLSAAGVLRIDHAMGLHRLYWVPQGGSARDGVYVTYKPEEQYAILCLESRRNEAAIVGENLGIVPDAINASLSRHGISRMFVMSIEMTGDPKEPHRPIPRGVVASFGTHDLPPFAAYWQNTDVADRKRLGVLSNERSAVEAKDREEQKAALLSFLRKGGLLAEDDNDAAAVYKGVVELLARSPAKRALLNVEDLWQDTAPQNIPGTTQDQYRNWSHLAEYDLDDLAGLRGPSAVLAVLRRLRPRT
jgi:4-alpha-glucanotransferase